MQASQLQPFASSAWATEKSDLRRPACPKIAFKVLESPPRRLVHRMWQARCHVLRGNKRCAANPQRLCTASASLHALLAYKRWMQASKNGIRFYSAEKRAHPKGGAIKKRRSICGKCAKEEGGIPAVVSLPPMRMRLPNMPRWFLGYRP